MSAARQMGYTDPLSTEGNAEGQEPYTGQGQKPSTGSFGEEPSVKDFKSKEKRGSWREIKKQALIDSELIGK